MTDFFRLTILLLLLLFLVYFLHIEDGLSLVNGRQIRPRFRTENHHQNVWILKFGIILWCNGIYRIFIPNIVGINVHLWCWSVRILASVKVNWNRTLETLPQLWCCISGLATFQELKKGTLGPLDSRHSGLCGSPGHFASEQCFLYFIVLKTSVNACVTDRNETFRNKWASGSSWCSHKSLHLFSFFCGRRWKGGISFIFAQRFLPLLTCPSHLTPPPFSTRSPNWSGQKWTGSGPV